MRKAWSPGRLGAMAGLLVLLLATALSADGPARPATPEERDYHRRVQEVLLAALPVDVPAGWQVTERTEIEEVEMVSLDAEKTPMMVDCHVAWTDVRQEQLAEEKAIARMAEAMSAQPVDEKLMQEYEALVTRAVEAATAGNMEEVQALQRQIEEKAALIGQSYGAMDARLEEIQRQEAVTDTRVRVTIIANRLHQSLADDAEKMTVAGFPAFRTGGSSSSSQGWREGTTFIFLGGRWFAPPGESAYQFANEEGAPHTRVQAIVVMIEAAAERSDAVIDAIDWQSLQAVMGR